VQETIRMTHLQVKVNLKKKNIRNFKSKDRLRRRMSVVIKINKEMTKKINKKHQKVEEAARNVSRLSG
jgi:hypothetical protein